MNREEKFYSLCKDLYNILTELNTNYLQSEVPILVKNPEEKLDVLDYFVNENYLNDCKFNG